MRCLLDKVTARYALQGLLKLAENRELTREELFSLDLVSRATASNINIFITPPTAHILHQIAEQPRYSALIGLFLKKTDVASPARYFKRWARRLRDFNFSREDAAVLALSTFGTNHDASIIGMGFVATYDQPMIINWSNEKQRIQKRLSSMRVQLPKPYCRVSLPEVLQPERILP